MAPRRSPVPESTPQPPQSIPTFYPEHGGPDFTLQCVIELQKSVGEMNATMRGMKESLDGVKSKVDDLIGWKHKIIGGAAVLVVVGGLVGWVIGKASDYVSVRVPPGIPVTIAPLAAPAAVPASR